MLKYISRRFRGLLTPATKGEVSNQEPAVIWCPLGSSDGGNRVRPLVEAYGNAHDRNEPFETVVSDLLADLFHLISDEGESPEALMSRALMHFDAEREEDDEDEELTEARAYVLDAFGCVDAA